MEPSWQVGPPGPGAGLRGKACPGKCPYSTWARVALVDRQPALCVLLQLLTWRQKTKSTMSGLLLGCFWNSEQRVGVRAQGLEHQVHAKILQGGCRILEPGSPGAAKVGMPHSPPSGPSGLQLEAEEEDRTGTQWPFSTGRFPSPQGPGSCGGPGSPCPREGDLVASRLPGPAVPVSRSGFCTCKCVPSCPFPWMHLWGQSSRAEVPTPATSCWGDPWGAARAEWEGHTQYMDFPVLWEGKSLTWWVLNGKHGCPNPRKT